MMRQYELVERVSSYNPNADEALLNKAYVYAMTKHGDQTRASGDPYFSHPLEVAAILTDLKLDDETIAVALLHDTIEDTDATRVEIEEMFGARIGGLVDGLTKLKKLDLVSKRAEQAENLRKLLLAISQDVRVLLVKLADRLHNMRTISHMPEHKRRRIAEETMDIYAPLAGRMGMHDFRSELESLAFQTLNPEAYEMITTKLDQLTDSNSELISSIEQQLMEKFESKGLEVEVSGRQKAPYSIFKKMEEKRIGFEQLSDMIGFRIFVGSIDDCYRAVGIVHTTWQTVPGRFKDYISTPKGNDYRSIHTTVIGPQDQRVELQIRTKEMHAVAEEGIAAHFLYKEGVDKRKQSQLIEDSRAYRWLKNTIESLDANDYSEEFLEHTKLELFHDQVFSFTPKGKLIALPAGATPIDFAYAVHTDVGNSCVGAKVNGHLVPLVTQLKNGDEVEIMRSENQSPPAAWEQIAVTGKARAAIRRANRAALRRQYSGLGRRMIERAFELVDKECTDKLIESVLVKMAQPDLEDLYTAVGRGETKADDVVRAVFPDLEHGRILKTKTGNDQGWFGLRKATNLRFRIPGLTKPSKSLSKIPIRGLENDLPVKFAKGCGAVPGDRIVGIFKPGDGVEIYPIQAPGLRKFDDAKYAWLDVSWDIDARSNDRFPCRLEVNCMNEPGALAQIAKVIGERDANIDNLHMDRGSNDFVKMTIDLQVWDLKHLTNIITLLRGLSVVSSVTRIFG